MAVEHRTYLPLVGFSIALASLLVHFNYSIQQAKTDDLPIVSNVRGIPQTVIACTLLMLVIFMVGTRDRNQIWRDEVSLWTDAKQKKPFMPRAYNNLGEAYDELGDYDRAIKEFEAGISLNPNYFIALSNLGNVYGKKKEYAKAIGYFERALKEKPDYAVGHYNIAKALHVTGHPVEAANHID